MTHEMLCEKMLSAVTESHGLNATEFIALFSKQMNIPESDVRGIAWELIAAGRLDYVGPGYRIPLRG
jgi:hypothetical protein